VIITLRGEARAALQDVASYEEPRETLALLKMLVLTGRAVEAQSASTYPTHDNSITELFGTAPTGISDVR
jgi:hypothetical protein